MKGELFINLNIYKLPLNLLYLLVNKYIYKGEKVKRQLLLCFPSYGSAFGEIVNQLYRLFHMTSVYNIHGAIIEPTNICNLRCRHCSTQKIDNVKKGYMDFNFYKKIIDDNPRLTSIILTRNGEPLMHPRIFDMIRYASEKKIYVIIYTNGLLLDDEKIDNIFESGLGEINISMEGTDEYYRYNRSTDYAVLESNIRKVLQVRAEKKSSLAVGIAAAITGDPVHIKDIEKKWNEIVDYIMVEPLMGKKSLPRTAACKTLWRNIAIAWDGRVVPCCIDMEETLLLGNLQHMSFKEIINGAEARKIRRKHLQGNYPDVCKYCDPHFG